MVIVYSVLTAFFFSLTFYFRKLAGKTLPLPKALLIEVIFELLLFILVYIFFSFGPKEVNFKDKGVMYAVLAGVCVTLGVASNFLAVRSGLLSNVVAITSPIQIIFGVMLALLLLHEPLTATKILGTILGIVAVVLLSIK